jgi:membrane carboxypeptidase/penicillin-binding protein PbpC
VRLSEAIGVGRIYDFFKSIGLSLNHDAGYYGYGISLGTVELSLQNIVESYSLLIDMQDPNIFLI